VTRTTRPFGVGLLPARTRLRRPCGEPPCPRCAETRAGRPSPRRSRRVTRDGGEPARTRLRRRAGGGACVHLPDL